MIPPPMNQTDDNFSSSWQELLAAYPEEAQHIHALAAKLELKDPQLLFEALTHRSAVDSLPRALPWNERLEFLGDSVLGLIIATLLWKTQNDLTEGQLSKLKACLVSQATLARIAKDPLKLDKCLLLGSAEKKNGSHQNPALLENALEALVGAIYLDSSFLRTCDVVKDWFTPILEGTTGGPGTDVDYKSQLQELVQGKYKETPDYQTVEAQGPAHRRVFTVKVLVGGKQIAVARGASKKKASQAAAGCALRALFSEGATLPSPPLTPLSPVRKEKTICEG
ncbi:MAG: ribonuclease III [Deltaproteobacteria bacterium]|nr:ribonuclease III [Deltaproteobacteria bacterium]